MNTSHYDTNERESAATKLGSAIRQARKKKSWTLIQLAEQIGRPREWLNRLELGYSEYGEHKPPSPADLNTLLECLGDSVKTPREEVLNLGLKAEQDFNSLRRNSRRSNRNPAGKLTQAEVIIGDTNISQAIVDLINEQHSDAVIRNTGIKGHGSYMKVTDVWKQYREALGEFLTKNPNSLFKRVEFAATSDHLKLAKEADARLAGSRVLNQVHNAKIKFHKHNPLLLHVLIGQREAILALPQSSGQAGSNMAILVRDKLFVEALRVWYDEVLWDGTGPSRMVKFGEFDESFDEIKDMYDFKE